MPVALARAFDHWLGRRDEVDLLEIHEGLVGEARDDLGPRLLGKAPDPALAELLSPLFRCTYYPRLWTGPDGDATWRRAFSADAPAELAGAVEVADAWFRRDASAAAYLPDRDLTIAHLPVVRLEARFDLPLRAELVAGWRGEAGAVDPELARLWDEREGDLVGWMQWDLEGRLRAALPESLCYFLGPYRTTFAEAQSVTVSSPASAGE